MNESESASSNAEVAARSIPFAGPTDFLVDVSRMRYHRIRVCRCVDRWRGPVRRSTSEVTFPLHRRLGLGTRPMVATSGRPRNEQCRARGRHQDELLGVLVGPTYLR